MAGVVLTDVSKFYAEGIPPAVDKVNLEIKDGEFAVLVGPSGCGKSTTLRMIAGLEEISDGTIRIGDRVVNSVPPKDRDVAMVFQNYALYPHMTVYDNMAFGLKLKHVPKNEIKARVMEAAEILGITEYLQRRPPNSPAVSASAWPSGAPLSATRRYSSSTSRSPTSTRRCARRCAPKSSVFTTASTRR